MPNTRKSGQILRSKKHSRPTLRSGRGSRTNSNTSHQIPAQVIEADSAHCRPRSGRPRIPRGHFLMADPPLSATPKGLACLIEVRSRHIRTCRCGCHPGGRDEPCTDEVLPRTGVTCTPQVSWPCGPPARAAAAPNISAEPEKSNGPEAQGDLDPAVSHNYLLLRLLARQREVLAGTVAVP